MSNIQEHVQYVMRYFSMLPYLPIVLQSNNQGGNFPVPLREVMSLNPTQSLCYTREGVTYVWVHILCIHSFLLLYCFCGFRQRGVWGCAQVFMCVSLCFGFFLKGLFQEMLSTFEFLMERCLGEITKVWGIVPLVLHIVINLWTGSTRLQKETSIVLKFKPSLMNTKLKIQYQRWKPGPNCILGWFRNLKTHWFRMYF